MLTILLTSISISSSHAPETRDHTLLLTLIIPPYKFATEFRTLYILLLDSSLHSALYYYKSFVVYPPLFRPLNIYLLLLWGNWLIYTNYASPIIKIITWTPRFQYDFHTPCLNYTIPQQACLCLTGPILRPPLLHFLTPL